VEIAERVGAAVARAELGRVRRAFEDLQIVREAGPPRVDAEATIRGLDGERGRRRPFTRRGGARRCIAAADAHGDEAGLANAELRARGTPPRRGEHGVGGDGGTTLRDDARDTGFDPVEPGRERRIRTCAGGASLTMCEAAPGILFEVLHTALRIARAFPCRCRLGTEHAGGTQRADRCGPSRPVGHDVSSLGRRHVIVADVSHELTTATRVPATSHRDAETNRSLFADRPQRPPVRL
jgi:hypothetical protein